jgi:predicted nuclease with TOPRIM domain
VVAHRYDLIVRRKEIAYEQLLNRLEDLQKQVTESKDDIARFKDEQIKLENVRQRVEALIGNKTRFKWD